MAKVFVADIQANQEVTGTFVVAQKQLRTARNGNPFLTLRLADKTGEIVARVWERAVEWDAALTVRTVIGVRARSERFRDDMQLQIQEITPVPADQVDPADFLPVCPVSGAELWGRFQQVAAQIKARPLKRLLAGLMRDVQLMERFKRAPAAKSMHHAYLGGLLEHTVAVAELVLKVCEHYRDLDRDLLLMGAILHDLGKVDEFVYDLHIDYSHEGRLLGHMVLGMGIFEEKLSELKSFPAEQALLLKHLILSHHGQTEFGAVKLPMTREAFVLHYADDLDAKMNSLTRIMAESNNADEAWTPYQPLFERFFFRGFPASLGPSPNAGSSLREPEETGVQLRVWPPTRAREEAKE